MGGYCAMGSAHIAIAPARVMMMESTDAKMGRSMKKREIMIIQDYESEAGGAPGSFLLCSILFDSRWFARGRGFWGSGRGHRFGLDLDLHLRPDQLQSAGDNPFVGL